MHEPRCEQIGKLTGGKWERLHDISRRVYGINGLSPTIHTAGGGQQELKIIVPEATKKGYDVATYGDSINTAFPNSKTRRGRVGHGVAQTLTTSDAQQVVIEPMVHSKQNSTDDAIDSYRFYQQAIETLKENDCEPGDTIDAYNKRVNKDGISPTITTRPDGFKTAILPVVDNNQYELSDAMKRYINSKDSKYNVNQSSLTVNRDIACAKTTREGSTRAARGKHESRASDYITDDLPDNASVVGVDLLPYRIRKLTPRECFRIMGVKREDYEAAAKHQSPSSQYHLAGDSIVTTCLMAIFGELLTIDYNTKITELTEELLDADEANS